ncbi:MAG TPA: hydrogenase maturation protease [Candidatus Dormibacteraeota bacterium]|nr:hydrogenase maturation protease [Candidatus Dormibacteraeota bacterium]
MPIDADERFYVYADGFYECLVMSGRAKNKAAPAKRARTKRISQISSAGSSALVVGVGNPLRGDDAVGRIIAGRVRRRKRPFLNVVECSGEAADLMELWRDAGTVIVVDAVYPGTSGPEAAVSRRSRRIHRFDATGKALPACFHKLSTHAFGLHEAVELARALHQLPQRLIVFGVEGKRFDTGSPLSAGVRKIVPRVADLVVAEARRQLKIR